MNPCSARHPVMFLILYPFSGHGNTFPTTKRQNALISRYNPYLLRHVRSGDTHSDTDISLLQSGGVVDTITGHSYDGTEALATFDDDQLLLRGGTGEYDFSVEPERDSV